MDLRQLEIFAKVAEFGSFSRAAESLSLTQPTVSEHIRTLEDDLGVRLLDRLGRGAAVTPAGQLLLTHAHRMLAQAREARQAIDRFQGRMSGDLVVGASSIPGEYVLPWLMGRFRDKYPDITVTLLIGDSQIVVDWVMDGRVEIGVVGNRLARRGVEYRELMPDDIVVVVPAGHPWVGRTEVRLDELRTEPMIIRERGSGTRAALEQALSEAGKELDGFRVVAEIGSTQAIKQAVRAGLGVSVLSRRAVDDDCKAGQAWALRIADLALKRSFLVATHRDRSRSPLAEAFRTFIEAEAL